MNKRIISKVGKRHRPEIDMMEFIQLDEIKEFDLDKEPLTLDDIETIELFNDDNDDFIPVIKPRKPKGC